jgi:hypothetical protein
MQTLQGRVLSILKLKPAIESHAQVNIWRLRVSYLGPQTLYEMEVREPLRSIVSKKCAIGLNGLVEFEMLAMPDLAAGDSILIDAYEPGEKILGLG